MKMNNWLRAAWLISGHDAAEGAYNDQKFKFWMYPMRKNDVF